MTRKGLGVMDTQIFTLKLSVHATSAYIVVCSLSSDGLPSTMGNLSSRWVAAPELLDSALEELKAWTIIELISTGEGESLVVPNPASLWRVPQSPPSP